MFVRPQKIKRSVHVTPFDHCRNMAERESVVFSTKLSSSFLRLFSLACPSHLLILFTHRTPHQTHIGPNFISPRQVRHPCSSLVPSERLMCNPLTAVRSVLVTFEVMPPKGGKGGKSKMGEAPSAEVKGFQTRSAKAGLQVCLPLFRLARSAADP